MSRAEAEAALANKEEGFFIVRNSSRPGCFTITVRQASLQKPCHHCLITAEAGPGGMKYGLQRSKRSFDRIEDLASHYAESMPSEGQLPCKLRLPGSHADYGVDDADVGSPCDVEGYAVRGTLRFFGRHAVNGQMRCGVELDHPIGKNNGTVSGHVYFSCPPNCGILCRPDKVRIARLEAPPPPVPTSSRPRGDSATPNSGRPIPRTPSSSSAVDNTPFMFAGEPWWIGMIQGSNAAKFLAKGEIGDYVVRESQSTENCYVLGILLAKGTTEYKIKHEGGMFLFYNVETRSEAYPTMQLLIDNMVEALQPAAILFDACPKLRTRWEMTQARARSAAIDSRMHEMNKEIVAVPTDFGLEMEAWYVDSVRASEAAMQLEMCDPSTYVLVPHINDSYVLIIKEKKKVVQVQINRMGGVYQPVGGSVMTSLSDICAADKRCKIPGRTIFEDNFIEGTNPRLGTIGSRPPPSVGGGRPPQPPPPVQEESKAFEAEDDDDEAGEAEYMNDDAQQAVLAQRATGNSGGGGGGQAGFQGFDELGDEFDGGDYEDPPQPDDDSGLNDGEVPTHHPWDDGDFGDDEI